MRSCRLSILMFHLTEVMADFPLIRAFQLDPVSEPP